MKNLILIALIFVPFITKSQNQIDWDGKYQLQLSDFLSKETQIGNVDIYSLNTASYIDFFFNMTTGEFMFTKNFNPKVNCSFKRDAAYLIAPDSLTAINLLNFAQYEFDLSELYARKFRKNLYENKDAFSDVSFYKPIFDEIMKEYTERHSKASKETDLGKDKEKLVAFHEEVLKEIQELSYFCKTCKPHKKSK